MTDTIRPYRIEIPESALDDLKRRLAATRWPERAPVEDWSQGTPLGYLQEICRYWGERYDWRATEARLNRLPQFVTEIDGLDIHFVHLRSKHASARPLVMTHGWPGSIVEFLKVIEPLVDPTAHGGAAEDAFHIVLPSLPGYGFSGKPTQTGWGVERIARAWATLMQRLGYTSYLAQGGDWGASVTTWIGIQDPARCAGIHLNMPIVAVDKSTLDDLTPLERSALDGRKYYADWDSGYSKEQSTRPQTVGYGLVDSPAALAGWVFEKFHAWTDCDGHPENVLTRNALLDNLMFYWLPGAGASSARLYWESFARTGLDPVRVPSGASLFPKEIFRASRRWVEKRYVNLVYWNELARGGHFAAFEQPEAFVRELRACFRLMR
jgi:pimeloyl-ACP methyl ester carboxylesterase